MRGVLTRRPLVEAQTQSAAPLLSLSYHPHRCIMGSSLMSLPLVNDRRLGIGVKHHRMRHSEYNPPSSRPPHSRLSCMSPPVMLRVAGSPLPFSHVVLVGRSALSVFMLCTCNDIPTLQEAAETADQHRVLSLLPLKPPSSRIQETNKQTQQCAPSELVSTSCGR